MATQTRVIVAAMADKSQRRIAKEVGLANKLDHFIFLLRPDHHPLPWVELAGPDGVADHEASISRDFGTNNRRSRRNS